MDCEVEYIVTEGETIKLKNKEIKMSKHKWLNNAVVYNIYPQSFMDSNGDGIGDLQGIIQKLDYIEDMGYSAIWLNPVYESPFKDAGYDISDFYKIAPRYGTNDDFKALCKECKKRGIKVIMDLVAGHTSTECEWFKKSALPEKNEYTNRYVWTDTVFDAVGYNANFVNGWSDRDARFMSNFFYCQPALNYGFKRVTRPWQLPMDHPDCMATRNELLNIMDFWSNLGADGFRVDMAASLVKDDPDGSGIKELWTYLKSEHLKKHPDAVLIAEWADPLTSIPAGFDVDFMLHCVNESYISLFRYEKGKNTTSELFGTGDSYFRPEGKGDINTFLNIYMPFYEGTKNDGYVSIPTGNHDMPRISMDRDVDDLKIAYTFILTMPGVPFVYYGDEIGMKYIEGLVSKEGGYNRTGARTPMQWNSGKNLGFSTADEIYLPVDSSNDAPTVENQFNDENSLLNFTKQLIKIRKETKALGDEGSFEILEKGYPFVYKRDDYIIVINPKNEAITKEFDKEISLTSGVNAQIKNNTLYINGKGAAIIKA